MAKIFDIREIRRITSLYPEWCEFGEIPAEFETEEGKMRVQTDKCMTPIEYGVVAVASVDGDGNNIAYGWTDHPQLIAALAKVVAECSETMGDGRNFRTGDMEVPTKEEAAEIYKEFGIPRNPEVMQTMHRFGEIIGHDGRPSEKL